MAYECKLLETYEGFGPELTTDGNMEDAPTTNWTAGGGAAIAANTVTVHGGCQSLRVTDGGAGGGYAYQNVTVEPGHKYKIEIWGYSAAAGDTWRVRVYIGGTVRWTGDTHDVLAPVAWEKDTKFYRIPDTVTTIQIRLEVVGAAKVVYFDDVSIKREAPVPMTEINLQYNVGAGFSLLDRGIAVGRPERVSLYGGRLELELVRQEDGKRTIPLKLIVEGTDGEDLIARVNALEEMLRHAARYRYDGWGGEVFLSLKIDDATHAVWFPVLEGEIETDLLYSKCGGEPQDMIKELPVWVTCQPYWESPYSYDLSNLLDNPGFEEWNGGICDSQPDGWTDYESIVAGTGTNNQETDIVDEGCEALRIEVNGINNGDYKGVTQQIQARLRADTEYTLLSWVRNEAITNGVVQVWAFGSATGALGFAVNSGAANPEYTVYSCQFTPAAADIAGNVNIFVLIGATANGCSGIAYIDKLLVMEASNVPVGWKSSDYLVNHYDRTANHINFTSVCDIPGETEAECRITYESDQVISYVHVAKRTRNNPCSFIWELLAVDAVVTAADANCKDSTIVGGDGTAPGGSHVAVSFAGFQTMQLRCYWDITSDLMSYYGKVILGVLAYATGGVDTINMKVRGRDESNVMGYGIKRVVPAVTYGVGTDWMLVTGWEVLSYRIGTADDDLMGTGNNWRIELYAEHVSGDGITDTLKIAGAYLIPVDESYLIGGQWAAFGGGTDEPFVIKDMDGDRGVYGYYADVDAWHPNLGAVGVYPSLTPKVENYLYFIGSYGADPEIDITDTERVSVTYRPCGVFLRGANP
jgi:hypothetical protein